MNGGSWELPHVMGFQTAQGFSFKLEHLILDWNYVVKHFYLPLVSFLINCAVI